MTKKEAKIKAAEAERNKEAAHTMLRQCEQRVDTIIWLNVNSLRFIYRKKHID